MTIFVCVFVAMFVVVVMVMVVMVVRMFMRMSMTIFVCVFVTMFEVVVMVVMVVRMFMRMSTVSYTHLDVYKRQSRSLSKTMGGRGGSDFMNFGKSNAKVYMENETGKTFKDVAGQEEAKESLTEIVDFLHNPSKYKEIGARVPKGILLVGPPGTGKTQMCIRDRQKELEKQQKLQLINKIRT